MDIKRRHNSIALYTCSFLPSSGHLSSALTLVASALCSATDQLRCSSFMPHLFPFSFHYMTLDLCLEFSSCSQQSLKPSIIRKSILYEMPSSKESTELPLFSKTRRSCAADSLQGNLDHDSILSLSNEEKSSTWRQSVGGFAHSVLLKARNSIDTMRGVPPSVQP